MAQPLIMIVEDDRMMADTLESMVNLLGYDTVIADRSSEALEVVIEEKPDLALLDLNLPDFNGFELCRRIKANPDMSHIPVIFVSAENDPRAIARARDVGSARYLVKPIGLDDLERAIADTLREQEGH